MTEQQAISKVLEKANSQVGYREGANNYNKYAAQLDPLKITYGNKQNMAWCGEFVLWVFVHCFGVDRALEMLCSPKPSGIPLCSAGAQYFKDKGRWTSRAEVGNVIFFTVGGGINHTGIVTGVSSLSVTTVEGNSSDMVQRNTYAIRDGRIAGYGRPQWSVVANNATVPNVSENPTGSEIPVSNSENPNNCTEYLPTLRKGDASECVRAAQLLLIGRGYTCGSWGADGDFGAATQAATINYQRTHNLDADGIIGAQTWAALLGV